jgi:hypothetical protein
MEVVTADDNSAGHLGGDNTPCEDAATDGNLTGKRTFLVCIHTYHHPLRVIQTKPKSTRTDISSAYRFGGCLESEAHILIPALLLRRHLLSTCPSQTFCSQTCPRDLSLETRHTTSLRILEERLLLECLFNLQENCRSVEKIQKRETSTNLFSHGDSIESVEGP